MKLMLVLWVSVALPITTLATPAEFLRIEKQTGGLINFQRCQSETCVGLGRPHGTFTQEELLGFVTRVQAGHALLSRQTQYLTIGSLAAGVACVAFLGADALTHASFAIPLKVWVGVIGANGIVQYFAIRSGKRGEARDQALAVGRALNGEIPQINISILESGLKRIARGG